MFLLDQTLLFLCLQMHKSTEAKTRLTSTETVEVNCEVNECIFFMHMLPWSAWKLIC